LALNRWRPAFGPADAHVPLGSINLTEILCFEYDRVVSNDHVVRGTFLLVVDKFLLITHLTHCPRMNANYR
jgi:hypothetical protein